MKTPRTTEPKIDDNAAACDRCGSTRAQYTCSNGQATRKWLCGCRSVSRANVAYDVPRKIVTVEQWRAWWEKIDNRD